MAVACLSRAEKDTKKVRGALEPNHEISPAHRTHNRACLQSPICLIRKACMSTTLPRLNLAPQTEQGLGDVSRGYEDSMSNYNSLLQRADAVAVGHNASRVSNSVFSTTQFVVQTVVPHQAEQDLMHFLHRLNDMPPGFSARERRKRSSRISCSQLDFTRCSPDHDAVRRGRPAFHSNAVNHGCPPVVSTRGRHLLVVREGVATINALKKGLESFGNPKLIGVALNEASELRSRQLPLIRIEAPNRVLILAEKMSNRP
jgi:hypothetical protein